MSSRPRRSPARRVVVATRNPAKVAAIGRIVDPVATAVPLPDGVEAPEEVGDDVGEIAAGKARAASVALPGDVVVATDGGLLIPALGDTWDPRRTRRFAGSAATNRERADRLLALTARLSGEERRIGWREALAVARNGKLLAAWQDDDGPGLLARDYDPALLDAGAFWVPALWICPDLDGRRLAALSDTERDGRDDHWARLGRQLRRFLAMLTATEADRQGSGRTTPPAARRRG